MAKPTDDKTFDGKFCPEGDQMLLLQGGGEQNIRRARKIRRKGKRRKGIGIKARPSMMIANNLVFCGGINILF